MRSGSRRTSAPSRWTRTSPSSPLAAAGPTVAAPTCRSPTTSSATFSPSPADLCPRAERWPRTASAARRRSLSGRRPSQPEGLPPRAPVRRHGHRHGRRGLHARLPGAHLDLEHRGSPPPRAAGAVVATSGVAVRGRGDPAPGGRRPVRSPPRPARRRGWSRRLRRSRSAGRFHRCHRRCRRHHRRARPLDLIRRRCSPGSGRQPGDGAGLWTAGGPTGLTGGAVADWRTLVGSVEDDVLAAVEPGVGGLVILPCMTESAFPGGGRALGERSSAARPSTALPALLRATQEGAAFTVREGLDLLDPSRDLQWCSPVAPPAPSRLYNCAPTCSDGACSSRATPMSPFSALRRWR